MMVNIIGHNNQINYLLNKYKNKSLHSSIIIYGPKGIGKRTLINNFIYQVFHKSLNENELNHHLNLFNNNMHPNIKTITKEIDSKSGKLKNQITIDQIRHLKNFLSETSLINNFGKFVIIDSADDLNISSANSILKTLEEPRQNNHIFMISHQLSYLFPTIRSRCLKIKLNNLDYINFKKILDIKINNFSEDNIKFLYEMTLGSPGNAISLYNENIIEIYQLTIDCLFEDEFKVKSNLSDILSKYDNDKFKNYLSVLKTILIFLNKIKLDKYKKYEIISNNFNKLEKIAENLTTKKIIDRLEFIANNEKDLFSLNLDKKLFMLNLLSN